ncbi:MAG: hypothetical protein LBS77_02105 [Desulfovibrio sp.]|jgi:5-methyltetrahydropteroyltriglutamate--homocysteine methyltransferase|nr:hypothetical protein [Desulfovibrio sp.]
MIGKDELRVVEDSAITDLVARQKDSGLRATGGELRRSCWHYDFLAEHIALTGKIDFSEHPMLKDFAFLRSLTTVMKSFPAPNLYANEEALINAITLEYKKRCGYFTPAAAGIYNWMTQVGVLFAFRNN